MGTALQNGSTLTTGTDSTPGITITANPIFGTFAQGLFAAKDYQGIDIWFTGNDQNKNSVVYGDRLRALNGSFASVGFDGRNGRAVPACMTFPAAATSSTTYVRVMSGSGTPDSTVEDPEQNDLYHRTTDPPTFYRYKNATWVAL